MTEQPEQSKQPEQPDTGAADPAVAAALAAFAAGDGSEHAALTALAASRLLVPVVATLTEAAESAGPTGSALKVDKSSEMALPTLIGADGRAAVPAFTSMTAMTAWRPDARPVPVPAAGVCQAAVEQGWAVVIDVAGPVGLAIEGARLHAMAEQMPIPQPWSDPDVLEVITAVTAELATGIAIALRPPGASRDLRIELAVPAGVREDVADLVGSAVMHRLRHRLRRGVSIAVHPAPAGN
jgi:hypothetical protein